jgi:hypothetical protein
MVEKQELFYPSAQEMQEIDLFGARFPLVSACRLGTQMPTPTESHNLRYRPSRRWRKGDGSFRKVQCQQGRTQSWLRCAFLTTVEPFSTAFHKLVEAQVSFQILVT